MEASSSIGDAGESARVSQESGALPFTSLRGLQVAFTGEMVAYPKVCGPSRTFTGAQRKALRAALEADGNERLRLMRLAEEAGAFVEYRVTRRLDLLVAGKRPGSRLTAVQENLRNGLSKTVVVSPDTFRRLLEVSR